MAFAADTPITIPSGITQIRDLRVADLVLAAGLDLQWQQYEVKFAEGEASAALMFYLRLAGDQELIVTPDQPFLLPGGALQTAEQLRAGDKLVGAGRQQIELLHIIGGEYTGRVSAFATSAPPGVDGHLIEANGVVVGDYDLEVGRPNES